MPNESPVGVLSSLSASSAGAFRGRDALTRGVSRKQLSTLVRHGVIERLHPDTYRMTAQPTSGAQRLRAALLWAGTDAAAAGRSAGEVYGLEGVRAPGPEIVVPHGVRARSSRITVFHGRPAALMVRTVGAVRVTGIEATLLRLTTQLRAEPFEAAFEDARRRHLTSIPALQAYLDRFGCRGRPGVAPMRRLLGELDPTHAARSALEVKTRRLLVAHGITSFVREYPLSWNGRTFLFDFGFPRERIVLETNGRRWHDDAADYEHDHEKWSVPGRCGHRLVFATWAKVTERPHDLLHELRVTLATP